MWLILVYINLIGLVIGAKFPVNSNVSFYTPQKLSNCKAKLDDGSIVDLTSQDKPNSPRFI
jgi:hypothetical protein